ncbi:MAG: hypothetical protein OQK04_15655, partial [Kangiellaceae bacterium]|nr:hypothetical protein [Kangiellaceae bacterium]
QVVDELTSKYSLANVETRVVYIPMQGVAVTIDKVEFDKSIQNALDAAKKLKVDQRPQGQVQKQKQKLTIAQKQNLNKLQASARSISHSAFQIREQSRQLSQKRKTASEDEKKEIDKQLSLLRDKASEFERKRIQTKAQIDQVKHMQTEKVDIQIKQNIRQTPRLQFYMQLRKQLSAKVCQFKDLFGSLSKQETISIILSKGGKNFEGRNLEYVLKTSIDKLEQCSASSISSDVFDDFEY